MKTAIAPFAALITALTLAGPAPAAEPVRAKVESGVVVGQEDGNVDSYKGIPFAAPPVGPLRWQPPQKPIAWSGERAATATGAPCMQPIRTQAPAGPGTPSEDCLFVNVFTPKGAKKVPVMVWIHGGSNVSGSGANYDGSNFARDGVMVVTINYRMGAMGFFSHPSLTKAAKADEPLSNYALMDQIAALQWVQRNAAAFGGDPSNVTVFGESAGAMDIVALFGIPSVKGLFAKAIIESNIGWGTATPLAQKEVQGEAIAVKAGAPAGTTIEQLRALPAAALTAAQTGSSTAIDGRLVKESAYQAFAANRAVDVPLIIGSNSYEASLIAGREGGATAEAAALFNDGSAGAPARFIAAHEASGAPSWFYYFSYVREAQRATAPGAAHASEIAFAFDTMRRGGVAAPAPEDQAIATLMHSCWVSCAKTGKPACASGPAWPAYTAAGDQLMEFGAPAGVRTNFRKSQLDAAEQRQATGGGRRGG
ncbi:carboxylesterase family protein [soil metagenome]